MGGDLVDAAKVLVIGRNQTKPGAFAVSLKKRYEVVVAANGTEALRLTQQHMPNVIVLDAISMRTTGERICRVLRAELGEIPVVHIHPGPEQMADSCADVLIFNPQSTRKITNAVERLIKFSDDKTVTCGPLALNIARRTLVMNGHESQLTPKVALLLELFMRQPGKVLDRRVLMEEIWNTDYLGDTRTLDVHIRWIREAIEENPGRPRYLKTVRGVGYRLDVPPDHGDAHTNGVDVLRSEML
jgi:DNA-binding response OmpR family regulator